MGVEGEKGWIDRWWIWRVRERKKEGERGAIEQSRKCVFLQLKLSESDVSNKTF